MLVLYRINLEVGWIGILAGFIFGATLGIFFYKENWLGGYSSWKRRMLRLGHISFFGIAAINLFFFFTANFLEAPNLEVSSILFASATVSMPLVCVLSAFKMSFRHLFAIPVLSLLSGLAIFLAIQIF